MARVQLEYNKCLTTERLLGRSIPIKIRISNVLLAGNRRQKQYCYDVGHVGYRRCCVCAVCTMKTRGQNAMLNMDTDGTE